MQSLIFLRFTLSPHLSLQKVSAALPFTYTGADLYALCSDAMLKAITRRARAVDERVQEYNKSNQGKPPISVAWFFDHVAEEQDTMVEVEEEDFWEAKRELVPSVSAEELGHYERVRRAFEGAEKNKKESQTNPQERQRPSQLTTRSDSTNTVIRSNGNSKGKGKGNAVHANNGKADSNARNADESSEDDFVIRTDHLATNGSANIKRAGKGKGKEAAAFGDGMGDDDELYT